MEHSKIWILVCLLATQVRWVDADAYVLVADLNNGTIYKGSILQGLADLAPLPLDGLIRPVAVDYDPVEEMVYWTDVGTKPPKISKAHLDGSGQTTLINELDVPAGLALDVTSRMVYWTDETHGHVARIPMDGSGSKEIIVENIFRPRGIITDHYYGHIYWADSGNNGTIERANLDGTDRTVIVEDDMLFPSGLAIDHRNNKLFWCDSKLETIEQSDLFGNIRTVVIDLTPFNGTFFPFDLFMFNDYLYWTDWGTGTLLRVSKRGVGVRHYGPAIFQRAGGIHIYEDFCDSTPCMNGGTCSSLTVGFTCQCTLGFGGDVCQFAFCDSYPCRNGGSCTSSACQCAPGYGGNLCHLVLDFCESSPCMNGGTCTSLTNDFTCQCAPGYEGNLCDLAKRGCSRPTPSNHMTVSETESFFQPGEEMLFTCDNGYVIEGSNDHSMRRVCSEDGSWSAGGTQCVIDNEEADNSYALIIGGPVGAVALIVVVLLVVLIVIKRKKTRRTEERVIQMPDMQTIYQGGQTNTRYQADTPPPYNQGIQHVYQDVLFADLNEGAQYQGTNYLNANMTNKEKM